MSMLKDVRHRHFLPNLPCKGIKAPVGMFGILHESGIGGTKNLEFEIVKLNIQAHLGDGLYNPFVVMLRIVYYWVYRMAI